MVPQPSATEPDWSREAPERWWDPPRRLLKAMRGYQRRRTSRNPVVRVLSRWHVLQHRFWSIVCACDIPINTQIGGGLLLTHPNGVVVHPRATVGVNCLLFHQVTLVADVKLGGHVDIGAGAKIIRPVTVGDHARIGANAVVLDDVPPGATVVGIPARVIRLPEPDNAGRLTATAAEPTSPRP
ncbi:MAG: serine acetyltransferase [Planctomycetota bacterium]